MDGEYTISYRGVNWDTLGPEVRELLRDLVDDTATNIKRDAEAKIREYDLIDTGNLLNSIQLVFPIGGDGLTAIIMVQAEYGIYHELGTVHLPSRPFLYPAVNNQTFFFVEAIKQVLERLG